MGLEYNIKNLLYILFYYYNCGCAVSDFARRLEITDYSFYEDYGKMSIMSLLVDMSGNTSFSSFDKEFVAALKEDKLFNKEFVGEHTRFMNFFGSGRLNIVGLSDMKKEYDLKEMLQLARYASYLCLCHVVGFNEQIVENKHEIIQKVGGFELYMKRQRNEKEKKGLVLAVQKMAMDGLDLKTKKTTKKKTTNDVISMNFSDTDGYWKAFYTLITEVISIRRSNDCDKVKCLMLSKELLSSYARVDLKFSNSEQEIICLLLLVLLSYKLKIISINYGDTSSVDTMVGYSDNIRFFGFVLQEVYEHKLMNNNQISSNDSCFGDMVLYFCTVIEESLKSQYILENQGVGSLQVNMRTIEKYIKIVIYHYLVLMCKCVDNICNSMRADCSFDIKSDFPNLNWMLSILSHHYPEEGLLGEELFDSVSKISDQEKSDCMTILSLVFVRDSGVDQHTMKKNGSDVKLSDFLSKKMSTVGRQDKVVIPSFECGLLIKFCSDGGGFFDLFEEACNFVASNYTMDVKGRKLVIKGKDMRVSISDFRSKPTHVLLFDSGMSDSEKSITTGGLAVTELNNDGASVIHNPNFKFEEKASFDLSYGEVDKKVGIGSKIYCRTNDDNNDFEIVSESDCVNLIPPIGGEGVVGDDVSGFLGLVSIEAKNDAAISGAFRLMDGSDIAETKSDIVETKSDIVETVSGLIAPKYRSREDTKKQK